MYIRCYSAGFSFIEVIAALMILTCCLCGMSALIYAAFRVSGQVSEYRTATVYLQSSLDTIKLYGWERLTAQLDDSSAYTKITADHYRQGPLPAAPNSLFLYQMDVYTQPTIMNNLYLISVGIYWPAYKPQECLQTATFLGRNNYAVAQRPGTQT